MWYPRWSPEETERCLGVVLDALANPDRAATRPPGNGWLLAGDTGLAVCAALDRLEIAARARGAVILAGGWRRGLIRPFGGLLDVVDELVNRTVGEQPELARRYGRTLVTVLPDLRGLEPLADARELLAGLPAYALEGSRSRLSEFYQRRNLISWIQADLVHFMLDAAQAVAVARRAPVLIALEGLEWADPLDLETVALLERYAVDQPVTVVAGRAGVNGDGARVAAALGTVWTEIALPAPDAEDAEDAEADHLGVWLAGHEPFHRTLIRRAAALAAPFTAAAWARVAGEGESDAPGVEALAEALLEADILRRFGDGRLAFARTGVATALADGSSPHEAVEVHRRAAAELEDPFAVTYHAAAAGVRETAHRAALDAMGRAWGVSDYDSAQTLAEIALAHADDEKIQGELLRGLLCYEAGRYDEADRWLLACLERRHHPDRVATLEHLLGYNAIFGLGDFDRGKEILEGVLAYYDRNGRRRAANYVRNSMAFALFRTKQFDSAIELETGTLEAAADEEKNDDNFLLTILQLNLGRLYRTVGDSERALARFEHGIHGGSLEHMPSILLLLYTAIGHLRYRRGEYRQALDAYHQCLALARNLDLDARQEHVLRSVVHLAEPPALLLRGDQLLFCLHLSLAATYQRLGADAWRDAYLAGIHAHRERFDEDDLRRLEAALAEVDSGAGAAAAGAQEAAADQTDFDAAADVAVSRFAAALDPRPSRDLAGAVAAALARGEVVAYTRPRRPADGLRVIDSVILFDPRRAALAERTNPEVVDLNVSNLTAARSAVVLADELDRFVSAPALLPLVYQEATLRPEQRQALPALVPVRLRLQVLDPAFDGLLHDVLASFAERTGVGLLVALPFALRGRDVAATPEQACCAFLVSSFDHMVLGDRLLTKRHGRAAAANLLPFRPRLSQWAFTDDRDDYVLVRIKSRGGYANGRFFKVRGAMRELLELCDGEHAVAEIVRRLDGRLGCGAELERRVGDFLRELWRRGAMCFGDPDPAGAVDQGTARGRAAPRSLAS